MNPFKYRPQHPEELDWEDNAVSNLMAWASSSLLPSWCKEGHWTVRIANYLWAECACCLFFRGVVIGAALASVVAAIW